MDFAHLVHADCGCPQECTRRHDRRRPEGEGRNRSWAMHN